MVSGQSSLTELRAGIEKLPQTLVNVTAGDPGAIVNCDRVTRAVGEIEGLLGSTGRVLLRPSGTEPVVRVMVEGEDATQVQRLATDLAAIVLAAAETA
jgi:phosphoglucosamine mutase